jgi:hypothetical protein
LEEGDSASLAEALIELAGLVAEEAIIGKWRLPQLHETILRIKRPLIPADIKMEPTNVTHS